MHVPAPNFPLTIKLGAGACYNRHRLVFTILGVQSAKNDRVGEFCRLKHPTTFPNPNMLIAPTQQSHNAAKQFSLASRSNPA